MAAPVYVDLTESKRLFVDTKVKDSEDGCVVRRIYKAVVIRAWGASEQLLAWKGEETKHEEQGIGALVGWDLRVV